MKNIKLFMALALCFVVASSVFAVSPTENARKLKRLKSGVDTGALYKAADLEATDDVIVGDDLTVTDDASVAGDLAVTGSVTVSTDLTVGGDDLLITGSSVTSTLGTAAGYLDGEVIADDTIDDDSIDFADVTGADLDLSDCGYIYSSATGTAAAYAGVQTVVRFETTTAGAITTNSWTVPTGYDFIVLNAVGWKTAAAAAAGDTWDLQNNDGTPANIFAQEDIGTATLADKAMAQFDSLDDSQDEIEAGDTLELVATETADDDGAEGIVYVYGILKVAD